MAQVRPRRFSLHACLVGSVLGGWVGAAIAQGASGTEGRVIPDSGTSLVLVPAGVDAEGHAVHGPVAPDPRLPREQQLFRLTDQILIEFDLSDDVERVTKALGLVIVEQQTIHGRRFVAARAQDVDTALRAAEVIVGQKLARDASPVVARWLVPHADPLQGQQWHVQNTGQSGGIAGEDANLPGAWALGFTGTGQIISVVDGGVEVTHPDLAAGYLPGSSFDHVSNDADPSPVGAADNHGTAVAGLAAARMNGVGVVGAAYDAQFAVQRLIGGAVTDLQIANALANQNVFDVITNSWGMTPGWYRAMPGIIHATILTGIEQGREGKGTIYIFSAGNAANFGGNANQVRWVNWRYTICVSSTDDEGNAIPTSSPGTCILVNAPSGGPAAGITTTDRTGVLGYSGTDYVSNFMESSAAAPTVAGIVALMLQANSNLTWRDVQHILLLTADRNDPSDPSWVQNGTGRWYSDKYGFGRVNAEAAVVAAQSWVGLEPDFSVATPVLNVFQNIPDGSDTGVSRQFAVSGTGLNALEAVELSIDLSAIRRGDTQIELTSPAGTKSILTTPNADPSVNLVHTFTTRKCWGEPANGTWTVRVIDPTLPSAMSRSEELLDPTFWNSCQLTFHGTSAGETPQFVVTGEPFSVAESSTAEAQVALSNGSLGSVQVTLIFESGDTDLTLVSPSVMTFDQTNWFAPQAIRFFAESDPDNDNGSALWRITSPDVPDRFITVTESDGDASLKFIVLSRDPVFVNEGGDVDVEVRLSLNPGGEVVGTTQRTSGDTDLQVTFGEILVFNETNWGVPQSVTIFAQPDTDFLDGTATFTITSSEVGPAVFDAVEIDANDVPTFVLTPPGPYVIPEGSQINVGVTMSASPISGVFAIAEIVSADPDFELIGNTGLAFNASNYLTPHMLSIAASQDDDTEDSVGIFRIQSQTAGFPTLFTTVTEGDNDEHMLVFAISPPAAMTPDLPTQFQVAIDPGSNVVTPGSQRVYWRFNDGEFQSSVMLAQGATVFLATIPAASCGDRVQYYLGAQGNFSGLVTDPVGGASGPYVALVGLTAIVVNENFASDTGWTVSGIVGGGAAGPGPWERGNPAIVGTLFNTPPSDYDGSNSCFVTGNSLLAAVSGGETILTSPQFSLGFAESARLSYARWLTEAFGSSSPGSMAVEVSGNNGSSWVTLETVSAGTPGWTVRQWDLSSVVPLSPAFRVRFVVSNGDVLSALEAGVDAVRIDIATCGPPCAGDATGDGAVDLQDLQRVLFSFGATVPPGFGPDVAGHDGLVGLPDLQVVLFYFGGTCGELVPHTH